MTESTGYKKRAEEMREDVIFMYRTGEHITRIATRSGYHLQTVKQIINKYERERHGEDVAEQQAG